MLLDQLQQVALVSGNALISSEVAKFNLISEPLDLDSKADQRERYHDRVVALLLEAKCDPFLPKQREKLQQPVKPCFIPLPPAERTRVPP